MISNDKNKFLLNKKIEYLNPNIKNEKVKGQKTVEEERKQTEIRPVDVSMIMQEIGLNEEKESIDEDKTDVMLKGANVSNSGSIRDNESFPSCSGEQIRNFIIDTLENNGIEATNELVNEIYIEIIKSVIGENEDITLNLTPSISWVTTLIDAYLEGGGSNGTGSSLLLTTQLIDILLSTPGSTAPAAAANTLNATSTVGAVKQFILKTASQLMQSDVNDNPTQPNGDNNGTVDTVPTDEIINANNYPTELTPLINSMNSIPADKDLSINDYLLQFKAEASAYIREKYGLNEGLSDVIAMFLAKAVSDTQGTESGLMKDANISNIKSKFLEYLQDCSFLDTSGDLIGCTSSKPQGAIIDYIRSSINKDGFIIRGKTYFKDNEMIYGPEGSLYNGLFFKYLLTDYVQNTIFSGSLNESQITLIMEKILYKLGGEYDASSGTYTVNLQNNIYKQSLDKLDTNDNNSIFDELYNAIMQVVNDLNMTTYDLETADPNIFINALFGSNTSISASYIHQNENNYLLNTDAGIREIMSGLIDASNKYNVTTDVDYLDFLNVFIKQIYEMCGENVITDSNGNPILTKDILQKYFQTHTLQDLKDFVESKDLRNAYYMENIISTGGIDSVIDDFNQSLTGDCYLLATLQSFSQSEYGRAFLDNMIRINDDGTFTVILNGSYSCPGATESWKFTFYCTERNEYTFSYADLFDIRGEGDLTKGDWTITLIEAAIIQLLKEKAYVEGFVPDEEGNPYLHGGNLRLVMHWLTGDKGKSVNYPTNQVFQDFVFNAIDSGEINENNPIGNYAMYMGIGSHAYAVTKVTKEYIEYCDPYHPDIPIRITWEQFLTEKDPDDGGRKYYINYAAIPAPDEL